MPTIEIEPRKGREGNRWINERPSGEQVAEWFEMAVKMPEGLAAADYVAGVTLIPNKEKANEPMPPLDNGLPRFHEVENLVFTPYVKVETRIQFWHDLLALNRDDWLGVIEPVAPLKVDPVLPPGYSRLRIQDGDKVTSFITCTQKVTVYQRSSVTRREFRNTATGKVESRLEGETIIDPAPATKMVPVKGKWGPDVHSLEKAETGAVGRALGMAGMLVVPGTGVATAEDMTEAIEHSETSSIARADAPTSPSAGTRLDAAVEPNHDELVTRVGALVGELKGRSEPAVTLFLAWCRENGFSGALSAQKDADLKTMVKKLERDLQGLDAEPPTVEMPTEEAQNG